MTETVVHVTTLEQWTSVLDVWFKQGYEWLQSEHRYQTYYFRGGCRLLGLNVRGNDKITYFSQNIYDGDNLIEYSEFMAQQKEDNKMETYYVTQEQLDLIEKIKEYSYPLSAIAVFKDIQVALKNSNFTSSMEKKIIRYIGGDETIEFKAKEPLYRLLRIDDADDKVYMNFTPAGNPDWTMTKDNAFTAPLEEIKKWKTPAWEIEKVED